MRVAKTIILSLFLCWVCLNYAYCVNKSYPFSIEDRDPFSALVTKSGQILVQRNIGVKSLQLKGIIYSDKGGLAVIGSETYKRNDKIGDYVIVKIGRRKVILKKGKELLILRLEEE